MRGCKTNQLFGEGYLLKLDIMYGSVGEASEECRSKVKITFHFERLQY